MIGLPGARVILVDDNEKEALPIIKAFAKQGIPVAFFDGKLGRLPPKSGRLVGVRLAVLDMHLGEGGDANSVASALVHRIERIMEPSNGPYAVLIWTNHPDFRDTFERYVFESQNVPKPMFTAMITKAECKNRRGEIVLKHVAARLREELAKIVPLEFIQAWEGLCFEAATGVSNSLSRIAGEGAADLSTWRDEWKSQSLRVLRTLARANAEQQLNESNCIESILGLLNPLHADRMENEIPRFQQSVRHHAQEIINVQGESSPVRKAEVNTMLHLALKRVRAFEPGNIHVFRNRTNLGWPVNFRRFLATFVQDGTPEQVREWTRDVSRASYPLIVEISASCDFAQKKLLAGRFLCGLLSSAAVTRRIKRAEYIKRLGPVMFESANVQRGEYNLLFSSRQVLSMSFSKVKKLGADARLRGQALADLQSWFSYQAGRQGVVLVS